MMDARPFFARVTARHLVRGLTFCREQGFLPEVYLPGEALDGEASSFLPPLLAWREEGRDLTLHAPFKHLSPGASDPRVACLARVRCLQAMEVAEEVRPLHLLFHHAWDPWRYEWRERPWLEESLRLWPEVAERAARGGVKIVFENVFDADPGAMVRLAEKLGKGAAGYCLDTGHFLLFSRSPLEDWLAAFGGDLVEMHLHDNHGGRDSHLPVGEGIFDFTSLLSWLARRRLSPLTVLENHTLEETLASRENFRALAAP